MGAEGCAGGGLKVLFFPFLAHGHMLPMLDMANLFAARGVNAVVLTTPANAPLAHRANAQLHLIPFPSADFGLPDGCENISSLPSVDHWNSFFAACSALREPFRHFIERLRPDCIVSDMFYPWTYYAAAELGIPRLVFHGMGLFALSAMDAVHRLKPLADDEESFVIPGLPHRVEMLRSQVATLDESETALLEIMNQMGETGPKDYGVVVNSFHELESDYIRHYNDVVGKRTWCVGPLALCNGDMPSARRSERDDTSCLNWLDEKPPGSVVYVCFGSMSEFSGEQLRQLAAGLEASKHSFIWVVRGGDGGREEWMPEGFEERTQAKGLIIRGWAPQILILSHSAVGGFLTHCGWNSTLEGISFGVPLITWPLFAEQFYNERLIVDVLKIGVAVGVREFAAMSKEREVVDAARVEEAVGRVMGKGEDAEGRRRRARELGEAARRAVAKGGSSYNDMGRLIQEMMDLKSATTLDL